MTARYFISACAALMLLASSAWAETSTTLGWEDLVPPLPPEIANFGSLSVDQREDVATLAALLRIKRHGIDATAAGISDEDDETVRARLVGQGLDVDSLLEEYAVYKRFMPATGNTVVESLDGKTVRLPGYALPLEFSGNKVTEFLLVPYVGACIHAPPPPANQIVYVKVDEPYVPTGLYDPVWVTGKIQVGSSQQTLSFVDGSAPIDTGYSLQAVRLAPYGE